MIKVERNCAFEGGGKEHRNGKGTGGWQEGFPDRSDCSMLGAADNDPSNGGH